MPKFAANLTFLFKELPFLERFEAAADAGFDAVEVLFPYDDAATEVVRRLNRSGLPMVLINTPPPNYTGGERGFAAVPGSEERFRRDFKRTMRYAERLKPQHVHIMAGAASGPQARETFVENLRWATSEAPSQSLTIEPINQIDMPGYYLSDFQLAATTIAAVGAPNLGCNLIPIMRNKSRATCWAPGPNTARLCAMCRLAASPVAMNPWAEISTILHSSRSSMPRGIWAMSAASITPRGALSKGWIG